MFVGSVLQYNVNNFQPVVFVERKNPALVQFEADRRVRVVFKPHVSAEFLERYLHFEILCFALARFYVSLCVRVFSCEAALAVMGSEPEDHQGVLAQPAPDSDAGPGLENWCRRPGVKSCNVDQRGLLLTVVSPPEERLCVNTVGSSF